MSTGPRHLPVTVAVVLLVTGVAYTSGLEHGLRRPAAPVRVDGALAEPVFRAQVRFGRLQVAGTTVSAGHENALLQLIGKQFGAAAGRIELRPGVIVPDGWEAASLQLLRVLAAAESGTAKMERGRITLRGVTSRNAVLATRLRRLREQVSPAIEIDDDFIVVAASAPLDELCGEGLAHASNEPVRFRRSSAEIRTAARATLDKIIDVANDCRGRPLTITGHTDASGDERWNRQLSLARARAVADYLARGGIDAGRLVIAGSGSSDPVADNATAYGRGLNRRIEFEFR